MRKHYKIREGSLLDHARSAVIITAFVLYVSIPSSFGG